MNDLPSLLRNDGGNMQNWIKIKLIGTKCNRTAIGARVRVVTGNHAQMDEVHSGSSVMSQCDLRLHFGLGKAQTVDVIEVKWPTTQKIERFTQVKANQILTIREGSGIVEPAKPKSQIALKASTTDDRYFTRSVSNASWSPDGNEIVFTTDISRRSNLWKVNASGGWRMQLAQSDDR